jgi:glucosamine-6-phosphate deaminase
MAIIIRKDYDEMSKAAAFLIAEQIKANPKTVLGLATGFTPIGVYRELIKMHKAGEISFKEVKAFTLYEYLGEGFDIIKPYGLDKSSHILISKKKISSTSMVTQKTHTKLA